MIETDRFFGTVTMYCDCCHDEQVFENPDGRVNFQYAIDEAKQYGWKITKDISGNWAHYCAACVECEE